MSNHPNHRRGEGRTTETGPRYEGPETDRNSARARSKWKRIRARTWRRTGSPSKATPNARPTPRPEVDQDA